MAARTAIFFPAGSQAGKLKLGGAEKRMLRTLDTLAGDGLEAAVIFLSDLKQSFVETSLAESLCKDALHLEVIVCANQADVVRTVLCRRFDTVLYTDSYRTMLPFLAAAVIIGSRRVMLHVTTFLAPGHYQSAQQRILFSLVRRLSTHIDVLYPSAYRRLVREHPRKRVTFTPMPTTVFEDLDMTAKARRIVFLGTLSDVKGPDVLVDAVALVQDDLRESGYVVDIAGSGPLSGELRDALAQHRIDDIVHLLGQTDPARVLPEAEVFVSLQRINNYPSQSLLEALVQGCSVIVSDDGDSSLLVPPGHGLLVTRTPESVAQALVTHLGRSQAQKRASGLASRDFADNTFREDRSLEHYRELLGTQ
ncbi:MAG TPA: glycosyltransferase family 4 protein [Candidatus Brachybacterium merdigallinarum]|nr:glycosyltransferase family 4 protein [Candidatus Brachybacterium merdigallinarum]